MNCTACQTGDHEKCRNNYTTKGELQIPAQRTKTWCDCQHREGTWLDSLQCKHYTHVEGMKLCPSCGKDMRLEEFAADDPGTPSDIEREYGPDRISTKETPSS